MARRARTRVPGFTIAELREDPRVYELPPVSTGFVLVSYDIWLFYDGEQRAIDRRYPIFFPGFTLDDSDAMSAMRRQAMAELRSNVRLAVARAGMGGNYLIPM